MKDLIKQTQKIAGSDLFILIQGESGTGKELFAKLIHHYSKRRGHKFVAINCAAIPDSLLESELFGYERGAFTGAFRNTQGKLELASGGTLVLDEIGNMPLSLQAKLLRALQEYEFYRLGGSIPIKVDLRIISLTNLDTDLILGEHKIREDLYYRLAHHVVSIPPLRERKEDISPLITHFTQLYSKKAEKKIGSFSLSAYEILKEYHWPGNIRQLENEINRLVNLCDDGDAIRDDLISASIRTRIEMKPDYDMSFPGQKNKSEKEQLLDLLKKNNWHKSQTARQMNMTYQGLHKKMMRLGIKRNPNRSK
jgi:Nif-specific regulatory protein